MESSVINLKNWCVESVVTPEGCDVCRSTKCRAFIVADMETLLLSEVHVPYAAGDIVVRPEKMLSDDIFE